jgi:23S rRNA (uracil1939-C5)-methyltransferase
MQNLILKIDGPGYGGLFIGRHDGKIVMVKGAVLPGETVEVNIENDRRDYLTATVKRIIESSPYRIKPPCRFFGKCGGCHLQHIPYRQQVRIKEEILRDCLKRLGKIDMELSESVISNNPWNYRIRGQFKASEEGIGFHINNTRDIINVGKCLLMSKEINEFISEADRVIGNFKIKELHITSGDSLIAQIIARKHSLSSPPDLNRLSSDFMGAGLSGFVLFRGDREPLHFGTTFITLGLGKLKYTVSPSSFIQSNWNLNQKVVKIIKDALDTLKGRRVLDLYAGGGNFSLLLASEAEVIAVEGNMYSIEDGKRNLKINNIKNCRFVCSSAENFRTEDYVDIVILDPPRPGLTSRAISNVLTIMPESIVYMSCNPTTFSRDIKKLQKKYDIESVRMIDFFPHTFHIEVLAFLRLK